MLTDPAYASQMTKVTEFGVKSDSCAYGMPSAAFVMEATTFEALRVACEET